jgi:hypothetical protein
MEPRFLLYGIAVGILATLTMDLGAVLGFRLGVAGSGPSPLGPSLIGRWVGYMAKGQFTHADILSSPPLPGETVLGLATHYLVGIVLTFLYLALLSAAGAAPTVLAALAYGIVTTGLTWFLMFPAQGMGWCGRLARGAHVPRSSLYIHVVFGAGLALWTAVLPPF